MSRWEHRDKNHSKYKHTTIGWFVMFFNIAVTFFIGIYFQETLFSSGLNFVIIGLVFVHIILMILPMSRKLPYLSTLRYPI